MSWIGCTTDKPDASDDREERAGVETALGLEEGRPSRRAAAKISAEATTLLSEEVKILTCHCFNWETKSMYI